MGRSEGHTQRPNELNFQQPNAVGFQSLGNGAHFVTGARDPEFLAGTGATRCLPRTLRRFCKPPTLEHWVLLGAVFLELTNII